MGRFPMISHENQSRGDSPLRLRRSLGSQGLQRLGAGHAHVAVARHPPVATTTKRAPAGKTWGKPWGKSTKDATIR